MNQPKPLDPSLLTKLDHPVWNSLAETHKQHCLNIGSFRFFDPEYCPFGTFIDSETNPEHLEQYSMLTDKFFVVGRKPENPGSLQMANELICDQMVLQQLNPVNFTEDIIPLNENYQEELYELVTMVMPGYYRKKTSDLGRYYGIFKDGQLVAATGERMAIDGAAEVSAVVTHPLHLGKGYAKQLVAYVSKQIAEEGKLPFLHVAASNKGAIGLYEKLGFRFRTKISFWNYLKN